MEAGDEENKEDYDEKEEIEWERSDEEKMQDSLVVEDGMMVKFALLPFPLASTAARISQESPACVNTSWWSMEPAFPPKYCK